VCQGFPLEKAFTTLVRPSLDYASSCWDPHIKEHIEEVEKVQRRGTRFVFNNYKSREPGCVTNMLNTLQWEPLAHRRAKSRVTSAPPLYLFYFFYVFFNVWIPA
jgi:hypothetical protein